MLVVGGSGSGKTRFWLKPNLFLGFGVAVNDRRKNQQTGEWEDYPNFVDCTMFGTRGEKLQPYLTKGTKVAIEGKLRYSSWERDGQRRSKLEVIVDELEFMSSRNGNNANQGYDNGMTAGYAPQPAPMAAPVAPRRQLLPQWPLRWLMPLLRFMTKTSRFKRYERG